MLLHSINLFTDIGNFLKEMIEHGYVAHEHIPSKFHRTMKEKDLKTVQCKKIMKKGKMELI